jgi:3'-phosphoadenosine 5'-phosphosulfate sulfotransferase (PAPS reductase)/FAD synthetase
MQTTEALIEVDDELEFESAEAVLRWALQKFGQDVALATGFGAEGCVLIRMLAEIDTNARIFYLDTDLLFPETYELIRSWKQGMEFVSNNARHDCHLLRRLPVMVNDFGKGSPTSVVSCEKLIRCERFCLD